MVKLCSLNKLLIVLCPAKLLQFENNKKIILMFMILKIQNVFEHIIRIHSLLSKQSHVHATKQKEFHKKHDK